VAFPNAESERHLEVLLEAAMEEFAYVLDGRILQEIVPRLVIVVD